MTNQYYVIQVSYGGVILTIEQERLNLRVPKSMYESINAFSINKGISVSEASRKLISKALIMEKTKEDMDFIRSNIRAELENYLKPQVERIIKCVIKGGIASSAGYYLNAKAISSFVPEHLQAEYESALMESKKLGVAHMQVRDRKVDEFMAESEEKLDKKI